jgi:hypothetical protein
VTRDHVFWTLQPFKTDDSFGGGFLLTRLDATVRKLVDLVASGRHVGAEQLSARLLSRTMKL